MIQVFINGFMFIIDDFPYQLFRFNFYNKGLWYKYNKITWEDLKCIAEQIYCEEVLK